MKRLLQKLESLTRISFLQVSDARAIYAQLSTTSDTSLQNDTSLSFDYSVESDYCLLDDC